MRLLALFIFAATAVHADTWVFDGLPLEPDYLTPQAADHLYIARTGGVVSASLTSRPTSPGTNTFGITGDTSLAGYAYLQARRSASDGSQSFGRLTLGAHNRSASLSYNYTTNALVIDAPAVRLNAPVNVGEILLYSIIHPDGGQIEVTGGLFVDNLGGDFFLSPDTGRLRLQYGLEVQSIYTLDGDEDLLIFRANHVEMPQRAIALQTATNGHEIVNYQTATNLIATLAGTSTLPDEASFMMITVGAKTEFNDGYVIYEGDDVIDWQSRRLYQLGDFMWSVSGTASTGDEIVNYATATNLIANLAAPKDIIQITGTGYSPTLANYAGSLVITSLPKFNVTEHLQAEITVRYASDDPGVFTNFYFALLERKHLGSPAAYTLYGSSNRLSYVPGFYVTNSVIDGHLVAYATLTNVMPVSASAREMRAVEPYFSLNQLTGAAISNVVATITHTMRLAP